MKYTITTYGSGGELHIGKVGKEAWDYFKSCGSLGEYLSYEDYEEDVPAEVEAELPREQLHEIDNCLHMFGPFYAGGAYLDVVDELGCVAFTGKLDEDVDEDEDEIQCFSSEPFDIFKLAEDYVFVGLEVQKGAYNTYTFETADFDPEKLVVQIKNITDNLGYDVFMVEEVLYDDKVLEGAGDHDTRGKSADYRLYDIKNKEVIIADHDTQ
jgi:hypothetical protein